MADELDFDDDNSAATSDGKSRPNSKKKEANPASEELRQFIERLERLAEEKQTIADDMKNVMGEAVGRGYDKKAITKILAIRKKDRNEYLEEQAVLEAYMRALGLLVLDSMDDED